MKQRGTVYRKVACQNYIDTIGEFHNLAISNKRGTHVHNPVPVCDLNRQRTKLRS